MKLLQIFISIIMVLATIAGASAFPEAWQFWSCDDGTRVNYSCTGLNTLNSNLTNVDNINIPTFPEGIYGESFYYSGADDNYASHMYSTPSFQSYANETYLFWYNGTGSGNGVNDCYLTSRGEPSSWDAVEWYIGINTGGYISGQVSQNSEVSCNIISIDTIDDGTFHLFALLFKNNATNYYGKIAIDGDTSGDWTTCPSRYTDLKAFTVAGWDGANYVGGECEGKYDEIMYFNQTLTDEELMNIYSNYTALSPLQYPFIEPCVENWSEYHVNITTCVNNSQEVMELYTDLNFCNTTINLPPENGTLENISCGFICNEDWDSYYVNSSCLINDTFISTKLYEDINDCNTTTYLPIDNGTMIYPYCNYCTENINLYYTGFSECILPASTHTREGYYLDLNYASCCQVTVIPTDCNINNGSFSNFTDTQACTQTYTGSDFASITADVIGSSLVEFKYWVPLIILMLVILVIVIAIAKFRGR